MSKTVAAVVKLIDQFTSPSKQVVTAAKNVEKRFQETADKFEAVGAVFSSVGETSLKLSLFRSQRQERRQSISPMNHKAHLISLRLLQAQQQKRWESIKTLSMMSIKITSGSL